MVVKTPKLKASKSETAELFVFEVLRIFETLQAIDFQHARRRIEMRCFLYFVMSTTVMYWPESMMDLW